MNIRFKKIIIHNFLSFNHAELNLDNSGYTLIQGINKNPTDNALSNGSGKSALLESIAWVFTGETIRGSKDVLRINIDEEDKVCYVNLYFIVDNNNYRLYRQINPSKLKLYVNDEDVSGKGIRDTENILKSYLPDLNSSLIGSVIILGQGLPQRFTNNTPSGRKDVLEKLSKSDFMIQDLKNRISNRKKELDIKIREIEDKILEYNTKKTIYDKDLVKLDNRYNSLSNIDELKNKHDYILNDISKILVALEELTLKFNLVKSDWFNKVNTQSEVVEKFNNDIKNISIPFDDKLSSLVIEKTELETTIKYLNKEINKIKSIKDICPTCGQKLPNIEKPSTKEQEAQLDECNIKLLSIKKDIDNINEDKNKAILDILNEKNKYISNSDYTINKLDSELKNLEIDENKLKVKLSQKEKEESTILAEINAFENTKRDLEIKINNIKSDLDLINNEILYNNNEKQNLNLHYDIIQKMNTVVTRDFRGYLLISIIDFINRRAKEYSQEVFETDKIEFCLDGNNISISYNEKDYYNLSGGEKQKIDLIVQFSIRDMLCKYLNFSSNILAVDELFDNLDSIGCEKVLNLISNKLNDVESIYIITHHSSIPIPFDNIITVSKDINGISKVINDI